MVEKTQSAISILQQRQAEVSSIRGTEELVAEVQSKANIAIMKVKQAALKEIRKAEAERNNKVSGRHEQSNHGRQEQKLQEIFR
jgi:hypothetical protein